MSMECWIANLVVRISSHLLMRMFRLKSISAVVVTKISGEPYKKTHTYTYTTIYSHTFMFFMTHLVWSLLPIVLSSWAQVQAPPRRGYSDMSWVSVCDWTPDPKGIVVQTTKRLHLTSHRRESTGLWDSQTGSQYWLLIPNVREWVKSVTPRHRKINYH